MKEVLKFSAPWCEPCKAYDPVIKSWANKQSEVKLTNIDVESSPEEWSKYRVMSVPTTVFLVDWVETKRYVWPMSKDKLDEFIK